MNKENLKKLFLFFVVGIMLVIPIGNVMASPTSVMYDTGRAHKYNITTKAKTTPIPPEFSFALGNDWDSFEVGGCTKSISASEKETWHTETSSNNYLILQNAACKPDASTKGNFWIRYKKVGRYKGQYVDVVLTILDFSIDNDYYPDRVKAVAFYNGSSYSSSNVGRLGVCSIGLHWIKVKYNFYVNGTGSGNTGTPISVKGFTNYWDVDTWQGIGFYGTTLKGLYTNSKSTLKYDEIDLTDNTKDIPFVYENGNQRMYGHYNPLGHFAETFEGTGFTRVFSFARPANDATSGEIKYSNGGIWHSAVVSGAIKQYALDTPAGADNEAVKVGDTIKYEIQYTIESQVENSKANVKIVDTLSKGLKYKTGTSKIDGVRVADPSVDGQVLTWNTTLAADSSAVLSYEVEVTSEAEQVVNNRATVQIGNDPAISLESLKNPVPTKSYASDTPAGANHAAVVKGNSIKYSIKYANVSDKAATVRITDVLSKGLTYNNDVSAGNLVSSVSNSDGTTTLIFEKSVAAGASEELKYSAKVTKDAVNYVQNNAKIQYKYDGDSGFGSAIDLNILKNPVPTKSYAPDTPAGANHAAVVKGDNIKYKITLANVYDTDKNVVIKDILSKGLTYNNDAKVSLGSISNSEFKTDSSNLTTTLVMVVNVPAGKTVDITYSAKVNADAIRSVNNKASVQYGNDPAIDIAELHNPIKQDVPVPNTGSTIAIASIITGIALVSGGGYFVYRKYKKA